MSAFAAANLTVVGINLMFTTFNLIGMVTGMEPPPMKVYFGIFIAVDIVAWLGCFYLLGGFS